MEKLSPQKEMSLNREFIDKNQIEILDLKCTTTEI